MKHAGKKAYFQRVRTFMNQKDPAQIQDICQLSSDIKEKSYQWDDQCDRESLICHHITKTTYRSFCRFGDRNHSDESMVLHWIRNAGEPLDTQAAIISNDTGMDISPSELAQFIIDHPSGTGQYIYLKELSDLKQYFKEATGFNWSYQIHNFLCSEYPNFSGIEVHLEY